MRNDVLSMLNNQISWFVFRSETSLKVYLKKIIAERYECREVSITSLAPPVNTKWKFIFLLFQKSSKFNDKTLYHMQDEKEDACWINFILLLRIISLFVRLFIHGLRWNFMAGHFVCWVIKSFPLEIRRCKREKNSSSKDALRSTSEFRLDNVSRNVIIMIEFCLWNN